MTDVTPGWKHISIGFEGDRVSLDGLNPWQLEWHARGASNHGCASKLPGAKAPNVGVQTLGATASENYAMSTCRIAVVVTLSFAVSACASLQEASCKSGEQLAIQDSLYFGTGKPNGIVTPEELANFLEATVTPRFPQGLTVSQASGQWRGADGSIVRESTYVLHLVHSNDAPSEQLVAEIVSSYKTQFQQEAVLRVKATACVSF